MRLFYSFLFLILLSSHALGEVKDFYHLPLAQSYHQDFLQVGSYQIASHYWFNQENKKLALTTHGYIEQLWSLKKPSSQPLQAWF